MEKRYSLYARYMVVDYDHNSIRQHEAYPQEFGKKFLTADSIPGLYEEAAKFYVDTKGWSLLTDPNDKRKQYIEFSPIFESLESFQLSELEATETYREFETRLQEKTEEREKYKREQDEKDAARREQRDREEFERLKQKFNSNVKIKCDQPTPTEEGKYLWMWESDPDHVEMITVYWYPEAYRYGALTGGYLAVNNNCSVDRLRGTFSKRLEFER